MSGHRAYKMLHLFLNFERFRRLNLFTREQYIQADGDIPFLTNLSGHFYNFQ